MRLLKKVREVERSKSVRERGRRTGHGSEISPRRRSGTLPSRDWAVWGGGSKVFKSLTAGGGSGGAGWGMVGIKTTQKRGGGTGRV